MSSPLQQIKELIPSLPEKDCALANKFYSAKDWEALKDLTWSSLIRVENAYERGNIPDKYKDVDIDNLRDLAVVCSEYYDLVYPEGDEIEEEEDIDYIGEEDEFDL